MEKKKLDHDDYTVAWICPLEVEQVAALEMLDEEHQRLPQPEIDHNAYNLGSVFNHNVVIAGLPTTGNCSAATVVAQMRNTYPRLRFGLLVGIGGGVPTHTDAGPIRLGHIVVSQPVGQHSGAVQYDHGKAEVNEFVRTGFLASPPMVLLNAARELQVSRRRASIDPLTSHLERIDTTKRGLRNFKRPKADQDHLYEPEYIHLEKGKSCKKCGCDASKRIDRDVDDSDDDSTSETDDNLLVIHRGTIASGEVVMRDGLHRDALARDHKILCFEMEAAGALIDFPCLVIRGISDYSDSHKNDKWHGYAAAVAAAYARELFQHMPVEEVKQCKIAETDVEELVQSTKQSADYILDSRIKDWLRPPDASMNFVNASRLRHSDTGRWFLESDRYKWLKNTPGARLWLCGIPGCGKTVLSSTIIEDLKLNTRTTGTAVVYFFFSFTDESKQKLDYMLRSLIFQLVGWNQSTKAHLLKLFGDSHNGHEQPQTKQLEEIFNRMVGELRDVIVVLDALDESKERHDLLRWITSSSNQTCRFVLTSRSERDIEKRFASWLSPNCTITLDSDLVGDDINAYIHYRLKEEEHLSRWRSMHGEIVNTLVGKAAGMFRWVYCQLRELSECLDKPAVRRMLQTLPKDLNETYDRILQNIPVSRVPNAIKLLQFLTFSKRPLRLAELVDAVATEPDMEPPFDLENRISPPEAIIGYCSTLVRITNARSYHFAGNHESEDWLYRSQNRYRDQGEETVQLAHFSVREYLLLGSKDPPYYDCFETRVAHAAITRTFLAYLWTASDAQRASESVLEVSLIKLAANYWTEHARIAGDEEEATFAWTRKIFTSSSFWRYQDQLRDYPKKLDAYPTGPALNQASHLALNRSVEYLLSMDADPNAQGGFYGNALQAASAFGNVQTAQVLLNHGADVNAKGGCFGSALHAAAWYGHDNIIHLLLKHGANIGALEWEGGSAATALQVAAYQGHLEIVEMLLFHGADVDAHSIRDTHRLTDERLHAAAEFVDLTAHYTPLEAASYGGQTEVVKILLSKDAEIDARGPYSFSSSNHPQYICSEAGYRYGTPLQAASTMGHLDIVRILVETGADIHIESGFDGYPLHAALSGGHTEVSLFLIESGADIQARGGFQVTTLNAAVRGATVHDGGLAMVHLLIEHGVSIDQPNCPGERALSFASLQNSVQIVELLLNNGADVNAPGGDYGTALCAASQTDNSGLVRLLLDNGAEVETQGVDALHYACWESSEEIVQILLDKGVDPNARQEDDTITPLRVACERGELAVAKVLLANGADPNIQCGRFGTALAAASYPGSMEMVQMLLHNGADPNVQCGDLILDIDANPNAQNQGHDTLLYMASYDGNLELATMLLAYGADPNIQGGDLGTALAAASYTSSINLVQTLLDNGADVNVQGGWYGNALQSSCCSQSHVKDSDMIQLLLQNGASINAQGGHYGTALCAASSKGDLEIVKLLLREGADVNARGGKYDWALCAAAYRGHINVVRVLLDKGASINAQGKGYGTALCAASSAGKLMIVRLLLREGANVNAPGGEYYDNALCAAAYHGHINVVRVLLENGAVAGPPTWPYWYALDDAIQKGNKDIAELLLEEGALKKLTHDRAESSPSLKRSISCSDVLWSGEELAEDSRDAITGAWGVRRHSFDILDDAAYSQHSGWEGPFSTSDEMLSL
ncbi:Pfs, NACHT and ankyrin domain protein, partial [Aureobasidium melanogenum]